MALAFVEDGAITDYPIGIAEVKRRYPNTSFPSSLESEDLTSFGIHQVTSTAQPTFNSRTEQLEERTPALIDGNWTQQWAVVDLPEATKNAIEQQEAQSVRSKRNSLLAASDWTQLGDTPVDGLLWQTYRQELRDVTDQAGFPWDVTWPTEPQS